MSWPQALRQGQISPVTYRRENLGHDVCLVVCRTHPMQRNWKLRQETRTGVCVVTEMPELR